MPNTLPEVITEIYMIEQKLKSLDDDISEACDCEDFELADRLQQEVNLLKGQLEQLSALRENLKARPVQISQQEQVQSQQHSEVDRESEYEAPLLFSGLNLQPPIYDNDRDDETIEGHSMQASFQNEVGEADEKVSLKQDSVDLIQEPVTQSLPGLFAGL